jgi:hypothetical protein
VVVDLLLSRHWLVRIDIRALFHLGFGQLRVDALAVPVDSTEGHRRDQHLPIGQPTAGIDDQMANREGRVVEVEGVDPSDVASVAPIVKPRKAFMLLSIALPSCG